MEVFTNVKIITHNWGQPIHTVTHEFPKPVTMVVETPDVVIVQRERLKAIFGNVKTHLAGFDNAVQYLDESLESILKIEASHG